MKTCYAYSKAMIGFLAICSLILSLVLPQTVEAQSTGLAAFLASASPSVRASEEMSFPESGDRDPARVVYAVVTAYTSRAEETDATPCITANGHDLCGQFMENGFENTIAANGMPFGTHVRFPELFGDTVFVVRDRMHARYRYGRVDVWMSSLDEAKTFGVKRVKMEIF